MKVIVDKDKCTGCGLCVYSSPKVFKMEDYVAVVIKDSIPDEDYISTKDAAEQCPVEAIEIEE